MNILKNKNNIIKKYKYLVAKEEDGVLGQGPGGLLQGSHDGG